jgi:2-succinyl-5-enolpyruvyl-6-hydroxy-3-cyclohexene-1-carboxylate synthase
VSAVQTLWTDVLATALADAGIAICVVSPGSRSTPIVTALARSQRFELPVIIDERAAGFYALGAARSSERPVALLCTSGSAPGHYLPALIEAAMALVPLVVISADRPAELQDAGASQTIPQLRLFSDHVRAQIDLGPPVGEALAMRAVRRRTIQTVIAARGPIPGPVHINVPLRKPLEPVRPTTETDRALAAEVLRIAAQPVAAPPSLAAPDRMIEELADAIATTPQGMIVIGAMPESFAAARADVFALAARHGYPVLAEAGSQLRLGPRPSSIVAVDHCDLVLACNEATTPRLLLMLGAEPVAPAWPGWFAAQRHLGEGPDGAGCARWALGQRWQDPSSSARVLLGDPISTLRRLRIALQSRTPSIDPAFAATYAAAEARAAATLGGVLSDHPTSEAVMVVAAVAACARVSHRDPEAMAPRLLLGNSLPVRMIDQVSGQSAALTRWLSVATQRGASGIDGMLAGAAGAGHDGRAVLAIVGDVTFAHDVGSLALIAAMRSPVVVMVIDNGGGRIFDHLPASRGELSRDLHERFFTTAPSLDPVAIAHSFGIAAKSVRDSRELTEAISDALRTSGATVLHVPVASDGALAVRTAALRGMQPQLRMPQGAVL